MPSYCCAVNCKNNGVTNPDLSFFKFPEDTDIRYKWVTATRRRKWTPTKYSRLCSIHFEPNVFFTKKGTRLRLLPDAVPSIFDFRKIKSNRKKAEEGLDFEQTERSGVCQLELTLERKSNKVPSLNGKCDLCSNPADLTIDSSVMISKEKMSLIDIVSKVSGLKKLSCDSMEVICLKCSEQLVDAYSMKLNIRKRIGNELHEEIVDTVDSIRTNTCSSEENCDTHELNSIYCQDCMIHFCVSNIGQHLTNCKMKLEADNQSIPLHLRRLFVCSFCQTIVYRHNAGKHVENCREFRKIH